MPGALGGSPFTARDDLGEGACPLASPRDKAALVAQKDENLSKSAQFSNLGTTEKAVTLEEITMELQTKQPPELEFSMPELEESLTAYLSAIGGAIIGLLLTLLVLAIWNGGTLNFTNISKVNALEAGLTDVASDLDGVNTSVDALGERIVVMEQEAGTVAALQKSLATLDASLTDLDSSLSEQGIHISELDSAVNDFQVTRRNFELFTAALTEALALMETGTSAAARDGDVSTVRPAQDKRSSVSDSASQGSQAATSTAGTSPAGNAQAVESVGSTTTSEVSDAQPSAEAQLTQILAEPIAVVSEGVAPDALLVYLFLDGDENGQFDGDENLIAGATVTLTSPDGRNVDAENSVGSAGTLFEELTAGDHTLTVEDVQGYVLASPKSAAVIIDPEAEAGHIIYFAVVTTVGD